jgi:hypothetical protein
MNKRLGKELNNGRMTKSDRHSVFNCLLNTIFAQHVKILIKHQNLHMYMLGKE